MLVNSTTVLLWLKMNGDSQTVLKVLTVNSIVKPHSPVKVVLVLGPVMIFITLLLKLSHTLILTTMLKSISETILKLNT
jgi:hypothetical protein